jgi:hypothetical protein
MLQTKVIRFELVDDLIDHYNEPRNKKYRENFNELFNLWCSIVESKYVKLSGVYMDYLKLFDFIIPKSNIEKVRNNSKEYLSYFEMNMLLNIMLHPYAYSDKIIFNDPAIHKTLTLIDELCMEFDGREQLYQFELLQNLFRQAVKVTPFTPIKNRVKKYMGIKTFYKYLGEKGRLDKLNDKTLRKFIKMFMNECGEPFAFLFAYYVYKRNIIDKRKIDLMFNA